MMLPCWPEFWWRSKRETCPCCQKLILFKWIMSPGLSPSHVTRIYQNSFITSGRLSRHHHWHTHEGCGMSGLTGSPQWDLPFGSCWGCRPVLFQPAFDASMFYITMMVNSGPLFCAVTSPDVLTLLIHVFPMILCIFLTICFTMYICEAPRGSANGRKEALY